MDVSIPVQTPFLGKKNFPEFYLDRFSTNHTAGFFDQIYLWMKSIDLIDFLYVDRWPEKWDIGSNKVFSGMPRHV